MGEDTYGFLQKSDRVKWVQFWHKYRFSLLFPECTFPCTSTKGRIPFPDRSHFAKNMINVEIIDSFMYDI